MEEDVSIFELVEAFDDCCEKKKGSIDYQHFNINSEYELYKLYKEINKKKYKPKKSKAFLVHRPKHREVFAADFRDRVVQHLLFGKIRNEFSKEVIDDSYSCQIGKGTLYGINRCYEQMVECSNNFSEQSYIGKFDIKSFFTSIDKDKLWSAFEFFLEKYFSEHSRLLFFLKYISKIIIFDNPKNNCEIHGIFSDWLKYLPKSKSLFFCGDNKGLPIGNITSQVLANLFMNLLSLFVKNVLKIKYYGIFVDDFFIISKSKEEIINAMNEIKRFLETMSLQMHPNKIYIQDIKNGVEFLGVFIKPKRIYVKRRTKGNFYNILKKIEYYLSSNNEECFDINILRNIENVTNSMLGYLRRCNTFNLRKKMLDKENIPNVHKYFIIEQNYNKIILKREYSIILKNIYRIKEKHQLMEIYAA